MTGGAPSGHARTDPRQEQILAYIGQGMTNREIGDRLGLTEQTVKNSVTVIYRTETLSGSERPHDTLAVIQW